MPQKFYKKYFFYLLLAKLAPKIKKFKNKKKHNQIYIKIILCLKFKARRRIFRLISHTIVNNKCQKRRRLARLAREHGCTFFFIELKKKDS